LTRSDKSLSGGPSGDVISAPVIGETPGVGPIPMGVLHARFVAGSAPGIYVTTLSGNNGQQ
jgi:hypothetical protein